MCSAQTPSRRIVPCWQKFVEECLVLCSLTCYSYLSSFYCWFSQKFYLKSNMVCSNEPQGINRSTCTSFSPLLYFLNTCFVTVVLVKWKSKKCCLFKIKLPWCIDVTVSDPAQRYEARARSTKCLLSPATGGKPQTIKPRAQRSITAALNSRDAHKEIGRIDVDTPTHSEALAHKQAHPPVHMMQALQCGRSLCA